MGHAENTKGKIPALHKLRSLPASEQAGWGTPASDRWLVKGEGFQRALRARDLSTRTETATRGPESGNSGLLRGEGGGGRGYVDDFIVEGDVE